MEWMILPLKRYVDFKGRSRRKEYWMFVLFTIILCVAASFIDISLGYGSASTYSGDGSVGASFNANGPATVILMLALFLPGLAVTVRRLHDTDRSGWWILIGLVPLVGWIVLLVFYCTEGTRGDNRFGADPKGADAG
jgi:uncharacterized membrane protein YhaH (DUF805 family)